MNDNGLELDILAYADGALDNDPAARAAVERKLAASPELTARVQAYRAQTDAIREAFGGRVDEPVPEHLLAMLAAQPRSPLRRLAPIAAVTLLTVGAGAAGWLIGRNIPPAMDMPSQAFLADNFTQFAGGTAPTPTPANGVSPAGAAPTGAEPLNWLSDEVSLTLKVPDLTDLGYRVIDKRTVDNGGRDVVRLTYSGQEGKMFSLFLRPRWSAREEDVRVESDNDLSIAYWRDGPLSSAVTAQLPQDETARIAERIRALLRAPGASQPTVTTGPAPGIGDGASRPAVADVPQRTDQPAMPGPAQPLPEINLPQTITN